MPALISTLILDGACQNDISLNTVTFSNLVVSVGNNVFDGCVSLSLVNLTSATRLTTLGASVFNDCILLTTLDLSKTAIGTGVGVDINAFLGSFITTVTVPSTVLPTTYNSWTVSSANSFTIIVSAPCFLKGTRILTSERGYVLIEELTRSDKLLNHLGKKMNVLDVSSFMCEKNRDTHPYLIPSGCRIGSSYKCIDDLYLSPRHEILIENQFTAVNILNELFNQVDDLNKDCSYYEYYHITTDNYFTDVIMSNGIPSESFGMHMCMNMDKRFISGLMKRVHCDDGVSRKLLTTAKFMLWLDEFRGFALHSVQNLQ